MKEPKHFVLTQQKYRIVLMAMNYEKLKKNAEHCLEFGIDLSPSISRVLEDYVALFKEGKEE